MRVRHSLWGGPSSSECKTMNICQLESHHQCKMEPYEEPVSEPPGITSPQMGRKSYTLPIIMRSVVLRPVECPSLEGILEPWERESSLSLVQSSPGSKQLMAAYCSSDELWVSRSTLVILGIERLQTSCELLPTPVRTDTTATMFPSAPGGFLVMESWCSFYSSPQHFLSPEPAQ